MPEHTKRVRPQQRDDAKRYTQRRIPRRFIATSASTSSKSRIISLRSNEMLRETGGLPNYLKSHSVRQRVDEIIDALVRQRPSYEQRRFLALRRFRAGENLGLSIPPMMTCAQGLPRWSGCIR